MLQIRTASPPDYEGMLAVARSLPEWFNAQGLREMATDLKTQQGFVAVCQSGGTDRVVALSRGSPDRRTSAWWN